MTGTPQARKLGLKAGLRVGLDSPPDGWALAEPPAGLLAPDEDGAADVIVAFFRAAERSLAGCRRSPGASSRPARCGRCGRAGPPGTSATSPTRCCAAYALDLGLVDVKVAAVDEDWSGLRLVWRTGNRVRRPRRLARAATGTENVSQFAPCRIGGRAVRGRGEGGREAERPRREGDSREVRAADPGHAERAEGGHCRVRGLVRRGRCLVREVGRDRAARRRAPAPGRRRRRRRSGPAR